MKTCVLCHRKFDGYGNNPFPLRSSGVCCDGCNGAVISARVSEKQLTVDGRFHGGPSNPTVSAVSRLDDAILVRIDDTECLDGWPGSSVFRSSKEYTTLTAQSEQSFIHERERKRRPSFRKRKEKMNTEHRDAFSREELVRAFLNELAPFHQ